MAKKRGRPPYDPYYNPSYETRFQAGLRHRGARPISTPYGTFPTLLDGARALGMAWSTLWYRVRNWKDWNYL